MAPLAGKAGKVGLADAALGVLAQLTIALWQEADFMTFGAGQVCRLIALGRLPRAVEEERGLADFAFVSIRNFNVRLDLSRGLVHVLVVPTFGLLRVHARVDGLNLAWTHHL